jgi:hypothetical protein
MHPHSGTFSLQCKVHATSSKYLLLSTEDGGFGHEHSQFALTVCFPGQDVKAQY